MNQQDPVEELDEKLRQLIELRKKEEEEYGKLLTLLDQQCSFPLPQEKSARLIEIKEELNRSWDISKQAASAADLEKRFFWKDVAKNTAQYIQPVAEQQKEFNSKVVHLFNELIDSLSASFNGIREFHNSLILYMQRIIPIVDTKFREMVGQEDKNIVVNLLKFQDELFSWQKQIHEAAREHADLLYQQLDRRMETLQIDSMEVHQSIDSLQTSARSLHHLANAWKSAKSAGKTVAPDDQYKYFHFEEDFRGPREDIKSKFASYLKYFQNNGDAPVVDLGCGRGEFLELMKQSSIPAIGVDSNKTMVQKCREMGLDVTEDDLLSFLQKQKENSLGGIFCSQVVEHLPPDYLLKLLDAAYARLKEGAPILLETVNIGSAFAFLQVYTKDLTHRTPVHPDTLKFLVAACGFKNPQLLFTSPVPAVAQLKLFPEPSDETQSVMNQNMQKLNQLLFAHQEYAVLAIK